MNTNLRKTRSVTGRLSWYKKWFVLNFRDEKPVVVKPQILRGPVIGGDDIIAYAANAAHVPESTIKMAKDALFSAISYFAAQGNPVQIPELGTFTVRTRVKTVKTLDGLEGDEAMKTLKSRYLQFFPKKSIAQLAWMSNINLVENKSLSDICAAHEPTPEP